MNYASGTWTLTKEHKRMIQSTQRKMLRLIIQMTKRYKKIEKRKDETNENDDTEDLGSTGDEKRWRTRRFDVGSKLIKEWNGDWR